MTETGRPCPVSTLPSSVGIFLKNVSASKDMTANNTKQAQIPIVIPSKNRSDRAGYDKEIINALSEYNIDLICLAGYMRIVTQELVDAYKNRIINIHPALLPSFPGLHAQKQAIDYGVKVSGCTVHFVDGGMDTGPVILQKTVPVYDNDTEDTLSERILEQEHTAYSEAVALYAAGRLKVSGRKVEVLDK